MRDKFKLLISAVAMFLAFSSAAYADDIAVIDISKIVNNYGKAQELVADLKIREAELQKFIADARKEIKAVKTSAEQKTLEDKYSNELQKKSVGYKDEQSKMWDKVQGDIESAVKNVADKRQIKAVFRKETLIYGADDITDDVLSILNTSAVSDK